MAMGEFPPSTIKLDDPETTSQHSMRWEWLKIAVLSPSFISQARTIHYTTKHPYFTWYFQQNLQKGC
jgi:hypothetical protein